MAFIFSDVCYDADGNIIDNTNKKEILCKIREENNSNIIEQFIPKFTNLVENGFVMYGDEENDAAKIQDQDQNTETEQLTSTINKAIEIQIQEKNTEIVQSTMRMEIAVYIIFYNSIYRML
ncbi:uncharacterized protein LOC132937353 [Metopolophium dirhodum]|uniref:uncharacterized protein LOC132937353 n=1 Tax=Metopolophium dirhodum TaxID=44670 RepID=UPI00298F62C5|nr:uncharacterized protein LOC132937353 [Metopolophium dirhodum]